MISEPGVSWCCRIKLSKGYDKHDKPLPFKPIEQSLKALNQDQQDLWTYVCQASSHVQRQRHCRHWQQTKDSLQVSIPSSGAAPAVGPPCLACRSSMAGYTMASPPSSTNSMPSGQWQPKSLIPAQPCRLSTASSLCFCQ